MRSGRVADGVGERAGLGDAAQERRDAAVVAAELEDLLDDGAVLALEVAGPAVERAGRVGPLVDLDEQAAVGHRVGGAGDAAVQALRATAVRAAGQAHAVGDLGDGADRGELVLVSGHEQDVRLVRPGVHRQRERHAREDDDVVQRDEKKATHQVFTFASCLSK